MVEVSLKSIASSLPSEGRGVIATERACMAGYLPVKRVPIPRKSDSISDCWKDCGLSLLEYAR